jgi:hypothetical protein
MVFWVVFIVVLVAGVTFKILSARGGSAANARLRGYGVVIDGSAVKSHGRVLGALAGARAEVTGGTSRHTLTRVVTVVGAATKRTKAAVIITTANGGFYQENIQGASELRRAQAWVIRFNTMAAAEQQQAVRPPGPRGCPPGRLSSDAIARACITGRTCWWLSAIAAPGQPIRSTVLSSYREARQHGCSPAAHVRTFPRPRWACTSPPVLPWMSKRRLLTTASVSSFEAPA